MRGGHTAPLNTAPWVNNKVEIKGHFSIKSQSDLKHGNLVINRATELCVNN